MQLRGKIVIFLAALSLVFIMRMIPLSSRHKFQQITFNSNDQFDSNGYAVQREFVPPKDVLLDRTIFQENYTSGEIRRLNTIRDFSNGVSIENAKRPFTSLSQFQLNFDGKCSEVFKYSSHTPRDLIIYGFQQMTYDSSKLRFDEMLRNMDVVYSSLRSSMPNVTVVVLTFTPIDSSTRLVFDKYHIKVYNEYTYKDYNGANARVLSIGDFLTRHKEDFDRVVFADTRDVFFFNDIFKTFGVNDLILNNECKRLNNQNCLKLLQGDTSYKWFKDSYSESLANEFRMKNVDTINVGLAFGGILKMTKYLKTLTKYFDTSKKALWGYETSLVNYLYYSNRLDEVNITIDGCNQRSCFMLEKPAVSLGRNEEGYYLEDGCTPVVVHKGLPDSWLQRKGDTYVYHWSLR
ncbi:hypothetical protein EIN_253560 [Entamoeba invadens IP1]|uniref:Uncharacterized protein n=1 Tax=Entamoeba invadens IP1 TaxID=370355 RepID=A0A0A1UHC5_ENTIV|nr:hypothetical protein EIN_253560 [Entamoeba invadens IP1]ELP95082.1 hypothetical protein EIN_253560 [Entamoeba invadens IP1]|eukprot:XP_004261853.1 hypothetical protein EIN_253560 [Entamoeba invadens IP1]